MSRTKIEYGPEPQQFGHLYLPNGAQAPVPVPVVMLIHGGYWSADFHLNLATAFAVELARRGVAAWNVEYRRVGAGGRWAETSADIAAALAATATLLPEHSPIPLDLGNVRIVGHSAGAQLAVWVAGQRDSLVRPERVVSQAGALDLASRSATRRGGVVLEDLFGVDHASDPQIYLDASPLHRVPTGIPTVCLHGAEDLRIPASGSRVYVERAVAAGDRAVLWEVPGEGHNDFLDRGSRSWELSLRAALDPAPWSVGGEA
ncbi:alpha/beta hydrolase family protein [Rhodococcus sp. TAF43]|uniref:alpha/beta hydrolase family protein n=1 Tax=unclassified Rhodococcus (in: high G+C Gram-positive bacteria) TaxID=192944 RepID=UPI001582A3C8|nr:prolyl oligopeptidase family serine peptidase [Rhodococcus sp. W8901]QKT12196.1 prolyl oligopeptidase family serine peptidase [Rhodococcus sp. W8901]